MQIKNIFLKPVDRSIEGVIKADDDKCLFQEVEEYVLTNEISKRLEQFLDAYNNYDNSNGVWISGFFGSGKSHLLKMLALILENRSVNGKRVVEMFLEKSRDNEILSGDLKRLIKISSKSILFNIDQKADVISKTQVDALLSVFVKVFDEMCGYYGKQGHIAKFERDLDSRKLYSKFKNAFKEISGHDWETGREQALIEAHNIAQAYAAVTGTQIEAATGILDKYRHEYKVSIEDFVENVKKYIDAQEADFRLNFFVDEVGQYIAGNIKLMTNLQTIAETLATKCRGQAWLIVTAQEDMDSVVGEMNKQQLNDFSKIQARFACRMKLTSKNVDEVIKTRLLSKTESAVETLSTIHHEQQNNYKTLFDFVDGAQHYNNYKDRDDFVRTYPFVPYQFALFQSCIRSLSQHNAFEGKHSSVGERSMLSVFQQVAVHLSAESTGQLATFDAMYEGISNSLKSQMQKAINVADKHLNNQFAVRVLKALLLVKYVKEFRATKRNLCVLMLDAFGANIKTLSDRVEEALIQLETQTYIQRNGDLFEYLTDEEKDIEEEIKDTDIESSDTAERLSSMIFEDVIKQPKINHEASAWPYSYSKILDGRLFGRQAELAIHVVSPFSDYIDKVDILKMQSMTTDELLVVLSNDPKFMKDITLYLQTEKYIKQKNSLTQQETVRRILTEKQQQNINRRAEIVQRLKDLMGQSQLIVRGSNVENGTTDPQSRIIKGFNELINKVYSNMRMLGSNRYSEDKISTFINEDKGMFGSQGLGEAETDMIAYIQGNNMAGIKTTLKSFVEKFERKPYGWPLPAILCLLARLCSMNKVEAKLESNILDGKELERTLKNTQTHSNVLLQYQADYTPAQIRQVKDIYTRLFNQPSQGTDPRTIGKEMADGLNRLYEELNGWGMLKNQYPFLDRLTEVLDVLRQVKDKNYSYYFTEFSSQADSLLDLSDSYLNPLRQFMNGSMKGIYDSIQECLRTNEPNFAHVPSPEVQHLKDVVVDKTCFKGNTMQKAKASLDALNAKLKETLSNEISQAVKSVQNLREQFVAMPLFDALPDMERAGLTMKFDSLVCDLPKQQLIAVVRDKLNQFKDREYLVLLSRLEPSSSAAQKTTGGTEPATKEPDYIAGRTIKVAYNKPILVTEEDVVQYTDKFKEALIKEVKAGKRIQI